jgi:3-phosphoshikimate 1-carboxyvinyltransferase
MNFHFQGVLPASKSLMNRALVCAEYAENFKVVGQADCDDVRLMRMGLHQLHEGQPIECGHAGTVLRFLALRASRLPGTHNLIGSERLFSRPQKELLAVLGQLGVDARLGERALTVSSRGWHLVVDGLQINAERSSQFATAVLINAWGLNKPLYFHVSRKIVSEGYFKMSLELVRALGMQVTQNGSEFYIPAQQKVLAREYNVEPDMSSAFAVAALATVAMSQLIKCQEKVCSQMLYL